MVHNYKRKTSRQSWDEENMKQAIQKLKNKEMGFRKASEIYGVPKTTLKRRFDRYKETDDLDKAVEKKLGRFDQVFNKEQERELVSYLKDMESRLYGLTSKDLKKLAYDLAERNNLSHNFDHDTKMAGRYWLENFLKRNPDLSFRKPEATSAARAAGFNSVAVNNFFDLVTDLIIKYKLTPDKIFNVDETGITTVPKSLPRIVGTKGKKQVGLLTSAERGQLVTLLFCMGADGSYMPPMFIFPRKRMKEELMRNAPRGSWAMCHESGWIQKDIFTAWFKKFIQFSRASPDNPVLLLLDGHASHVKNLDVVKLGREHGVHILSFPPHCTHRLQPLDVGFMKPLSTYYTEAANNWLRMNGGKVITQFQIAELVNQAFMKTATLSTAFNSYENTGIWPLNRDRFTAADFLAASTTEIELNTGVSDDEDLLVVNGPSTSLVSQLPAPNLKSSTNDISQPSFSRVEQSLTPNLPSNISEATNSVAAQSTIPPGYDESQQDIGDTGDTDVQAMSPTPLLSAVNDNRLTPPNVTSTDVANVPDADNQILDVAGSSKSDKEKKSFLISPKIIMPFPKTTATKRKNVRRGKTAVITSSPYRKELEEKPNASKTNKVKKNLNLEIKTKKKTIKGKAQKSETKRINTKKRNRKDSTSDEENQDTECFYCSHLYSESNEGWVQCPICSLWAHCSCAGVDDDDAETKFVCENCSID